MTTMRDISQPLVWTLDEALAQIRALQPVVRPLGFHLALAGGVLNKGESRKDLDVVVLPLAGFAEGVNPDYDGLRLALWRTWGPMTDIGADIPPEYEGPHPYRNKWKFQNGGRRVDVFVVEQKEREE